MTSHRGRRRIPLPMLVAGGVFVVVTLGGITGVELTRHDPVSVIPVGSVVSVPSPAPPTPVRCGSRVTIWTAGDVSRSLEQPSCPVVDGTAVTR